MRTLLLIADHQMVVRTLRLALRHSAGMQVVGALDGRTSVGRRLSELAPDIVLVDEMCQRTNAIARIREANRELPGATIVLLGGALDAVALEDAFQAGADAVVSRQLHPSTLGTLLREVVAGNVVHAPRPARVRPNSMAWQLTTRELEILRLVAEGWTNSLVARTLCVTEQTVKFHLGNIYRKLGVRNRTEATRHAHIHALVGQDVPALRTSA